VGLRDLREAIGGMPKASDRSAAALPRVKQYRERDGQFHFKLEDGAGALLLQSAPFANPKEAGAWVARFRNEGAACLDAALAVAHLADGVSRDAAAVALDALKAAESADA
jgi:tryptophanyl-tRNA synthetase